MMSLAKVKKGDSVMVYMFTGCCTGAKVVVEATKDTLTVERRSDYKGLKTMVFDKVTGIQINCENPLYANMVRLPEDESPAKAKKSKPVKENAKVVTKEPMVKAPKATKKTKPVVEVEPVEEDEYEEV